MNMEYTIYKKLAERVSLNRCVDPSFIKFKATLKEWFPEELNTDLS